VVDSAMLTPKDWSAFAPDDLTVGKSWTIAPTAVSKLVSVLSPMTDAIFTPQPKTRQDRVERQSRKRDQRPSADPFVGPTRIAT